jgi:8-oxo-dGTP pyrophosphatase MutT (NUDIX family)
MFRVAVTAIIKKDDKVLITRRHKDKPRWPSGWTVPGGKVEVSDFMGKPTLINNQWYNVLENAVAREVLEETGLTIKNIKYLCSIAVPDTIIISYVADYVSGEVVLQESEADAYVWITKEQIHDYPIIDGIDEEIKMVFGI